MKKRVFKFIGGLLLLFLCYVIVTLVHGTITDYQPAAKIELSAAVPEAINDILDKDTLSVLTWNLGYAGLSAECNFFYPRQGIFRSKGKMIRPEKSIVDKNMAGILNTLQAQPADFYLLQEVDSFSKRNYYLPMFKNIQSSLKDYSATYAINFKVQRVPTPILEPWRAYGQTNSGLATYSKYKCVENTRLQLPGKFSWPNRLFLLDRCLAMQKIPTTWGKNLYLINLHNSAYDSDGSLKREQMEFLKALILPFYEAGDYVIVGGDWNQPPPYLDGNVFNKRKNVKPRKSNNISVDYLPEGWNFIFDPTIPTVRSNAEIYDSEVTPTGLIDFFLISPNIKALRVKGMNLDFAYSDHQPVYMELVLLNNIESN